MPEECNSKYQVLQYLMQASLFIQSQIEKCLVHHQAANLDSCRLSVLIQNEGIHLIKHRQIQTFKLKKLELIFFLIKAISTMLKYKGSWPSLGFHGVIFVYISQTLMNSFWFWLLRNELLPKLNNFYLNYALSFIVGQAKRAQSYSRTNEELVLVGAIHNPQGNQIV